MEPSGHGADPKQREGGSRISIQTLLIASVASASASFAIARIWGSGTLIGAAAAPVIVALVSEALRRPMRSVSANAKRLPTSRTKPSAPHDVTPVPAGVPSRSHTSGSDAAKWRPRWWMAVVTGLIAFAIVVCIYTIPDLLTGHSITDNGQPTTFFGGRQTTADKPAVAGTVTQTATVTVGRTTPAATQPTTTTTSTVTATGTGTTATTATVATSPTTNTAPTTAGATTTGSAPPVITPAPLTAATTSPAG